MYVSLIRNDWIVFRMHHVLKDNIDEELVKFIPLHLQEISFEAYTVKQNIYL